VSLYEFAWFSTPVAAAVDEWINGDQQGELFERSEFSHCRRSSFRQRFPRSGQGIWGAFFCLLFLGRQKE